MTTVTTQVRTTALAPDALALAERLVEEATSPRGVYYDVPFGHARIEAARRGIGREEIREAIDQIKRERGL